MNVKGNHPLAEIIAKKLFGIENTPKEYMQRMVNNACKAAVEFYEQSHATQSVEKEKKVREILVDIECDGYLRGINLPKRNKKGKIITDTEVINQALSAILALMEGNNQELLEACKVAENELTIWLANDECDCPPEGHICGRQRVEIHRKQLQQAIANSVNK